MAKKSSLTAALKEKQRRRSELNEQVKQRALAAEKQRKLNEQARLTKEKTKILNHISLLEQELKEGSKSAWKKLMLRWLKIKYHRIEVRLAKN